MGVFMSDDSLFLDRKFGWIRSKVPNARRFHLTMEPLKTPPVKVDLRPDMPPVYDQGQLGSCVDNATAGACEYNWIKEKKANAFVPSRLFLYYNARVLEGTVSEDSGSTIHDGIRAIAEHGFVPETKWPYDISQFTVKPPASLYAAAKKEIISDYGFIDENPHALKMVLAAGHPVIIGFSVYESFQTRQVATTGIMPVPDKGHEQLLGGHGVLVVGYNDAHKWFIVRNSWSDKWGDHGYFYMPYAVIEDQELSSDFGVIRTVP